MIDLNKPRRKRHQDAVYCVDISLAVEKGFDILSDLDRMRSSFKKHFQLIVSRKLLGCETGQVIYENVYMSPRPPPKISLKHKWKRELGSEHAQRPEVGQLSRSFQSNQPTPNPSRERTVRPVVKDDTRTVQDGRKTSRSQEIV